MSSAISWASSCINTGSVCARRIIMGRSDQSSGLSASSSGEGLRLARRVGGIVTPIRRCVCVHSRGETLEISKHISRNTFLIISFVQKCLEAGTHPGKLCSGAVMGRQSTYFTMSILRRADVAREDGWKLSANHTDGMFRNHARYFSQQ